MQGFRLDMTISQEENVKKVLIQGETILYKYEVVPLDYHIVDYSSPRFYVTPTRLIFCFDEGMEIYELAPLDISLIGNNPEFILANILISPTHTYSIGFKEEVTKLKDDEKLTRVSIMEPRSVPKYFLLREGNIIAKSYKTWAMMQMLNNVKVGIKNNDGLLEMLRGYFSAFNTKTMLYFVGTFLGYALLKIVFGLLLPKIASSIIDYLFAGISIFIIYWLYATVDRNLKRYEKVYLSYSHIN